MKELEELKEYINIYKRRSKYEGFVDFHEFIYRLLGYIDCLESKAVGQNDLEVDNKSYDVKKSTKELIKDCILKHPNATREEVAEMLNLSSRTVYRFLAKKPYSEVTSVNLDPVIPVKRKRGRPRKNA